MAAKASQRLVEIADALPLTSGMRILEIGCGPGVLGIDRSAKAVDAARASVTALAFPGALSFRQASAEEFELDEGEDPFDLAVAIRVGALDGRHPEAGRQALMRIAAALAPAGRLFIDGGDPLRELAFPRT